MPEIPARRDLELLYEEAACGLLLTDGHGVILEANHTFCRWLGVEQAELRGCVRFQDLLTIGARMFHQTHWQPLMQLQGSASEIKMDFRHRSGAKVPMLVNARVHQGPGDNAFHSIAAFVATDRDRYEQELVKAKSHAEQLLREHTLLQEVAQDRGLFAEQMMGIVSHDLRNPLTAIRMGAEMLALDETDPRRLRLSNRINQSVDRALRLIADLLDFTLARTGRPLAIQRRPIRLHETIAAGVEELRLSFPVARIRHQAHGPQEVVGDPGRLTQVLGNLVGNAERYGDRARAITVTSSVLDGVASIEVHNQGASIAADLLPALFLAMHRGAHEEGAGGGVGLGLYIVSEIAKGHGGSTRATSSAGDGTRIGIEFPAARLDANAAYTSRAQDGDAE